MFIYGYPFISALACIVSGRTPFPHRRKLYLERGRPPKISHFQIFSAILYVLRTGIPWRDLPLCYGHWHPIPDISPRLIKIGFKALIHMSLKQIAKNYKLYFWFSAVDNLKTAYTLNFCEKWKNSWNIRVRFMKTLISLLIKINDLTRIFHDVEY